MLAADRGRGDRAEPNPFGPASTATTIALNPDGSYEVTLRESQALVREFRITFGGDVHDGFRLPDDGTLLAALHPGRPTR